MGSPVEEPNKGIDASVGGLVWVRRRNGSWWPGRIVGPEEFPNGCLPTPRQGTPIKLLGREDASVDWYNLDKSKRIKAFRCGEYNKCIEKAKVSVSQPSKKAVKYARREDAILQALDLESARMGHDCPNISTGQEAEDGEHRHLIDESLSSFYTSEESEDSSGSETDSDSAPEISQSGVSFEEPDHADAIREEFELCRTSNDSEDDGMRGVKRMRGLKELGMGVASSLKRKRSQVGHVHEFLKKKHRRRTLTKVLECTEMVGVPLVCKMLTSPTISLNPEASESKVSGLESKESKVSNSFVINDNNSDSTGVSYGNVMPPTICGDPSPGPMPKENEISSMKGIPTGNSSIKLCDVPLLDDGKNSGVLSTVVAGASQKSQFGAGAQSSQSSHAETILLGNEESNESASTSSGTVDVHNIRLRTDKGTSDWKLKGRRNSRSRKVDMDDEAETYMASVDRYMFLAGSSPNAMNSNQIGGSLVKSRPITDFQVDTFHGWNWCSPQCESPTRGSMAEMMAAQRSLPYRLSRCTANTKYDCSDFSFRHTIASGLFDVSLKVKANYPRQQVPYVSLVSKLNDQAIVGHPLTVGVLEDGSCDSFLSFSEYHSSSSEMDHNKQRRARGRPSKKHGHALLEEGSETKAPKSKRKMLLSKKIRKLSSLTGSHRMTSTEKKPLVEKLKGPSIPCVPLKVVFSRINAALNT